MDGLMGKRKRCQVCGAEYHPGFQNASRARICRGCRGDVKRVREWLRRESGHSPRWETILRQLRQEGIPAKRKRARLARARR